MPLPKRAASSSRETSLIRLIGIPDTNQLAATLIPDPVIAERAGQNPSCREFKELELKGNFGRNFEATCGLWQLGPSERMARRIPRHRDDAAPEARAGPGGRAPAIIVIKISRLRAGELGTASESAGAAQ